MEISSSGPGEGLGGAIPLGYSTTGFGAGPLPSDDRRAQVGFSPAESATRTGPAAGRPRADPHRFAAPGSAAAPTAVQVTIGRWTAPHFISLLAPSSAKKSSGVGSTPKALHS